MTWYGINSATHPHITHEKWKRLWKVMSQGRVGLSGAVFAETAADRTTTFYFTPAARLLAQALHAVPCTRPRPDKLRLVVGDKRAWVLNFSRVPEEFPTTGYEETVAAALVQLRP